MKWYRKAAEQGNRTAQESLAGMYKRGQGCQRDYVEAHKWYNLAANHSNAGQLRIDEDISDRNFLENYMTPAQIAEAQNRAREFVREHPNMHNSPDFLTYAIDGY